MANKNITIDNKSDEVCILCMMFGIIVFVKNVIQILMKL